MADTFDPGRVEAVLFDSYGTLVDTGSAARVLEDLVADPDAVAETWRENALLYEHAAARLDLPPDRLAHVTCHWLDVQGATNAGLQGIFLDRGGVQ